MKEVRTQKRIPLNDIDRPEVGRCSKCRRCTWDEKEIGSRCGVTQPNGQKCTGVFIPMDAF